MAPADVALSLVSGGRGLLDLTHPGTDGGLHDMVLATPGLDRMISGVLVGPPALGTVGSLREAGACGVAGVVFIPPRHDGRLAAHLAAVQWLRPGRPVGFCLGPALPRSVAAVWRGRPDRVAGARQELRSRFAMTSAVLRAGLRELPRSPSTTAPICHIVVT